jgi:hypothetical protein
LNMDNQQQLTTIEHEPDLQAEQTEQQIAVVEQETEEQQNLRAFLTTAISLNKLSYPQVTKNGNPKKTHINTEHWLKSAGISFRYNTFAMAVEVLGVQGVHFMSEAIARRIHLAMEFSGYEIEEAKAIKHFKNHAHNHPYNPLKIMFDNLKWDGVPRVENLFSHYLGAKEDERYLRFISKSYMMAAVRRIRNPGFHYKYIPVIEGRQDARKSSFCKTLALDIYFCDSLPLGSDDKIVIEQTKGKFIVEIAELGSMSKAKKSVDQTKHFLSRSTDLSRLAYGTDTEERPRMFTIIATTNNSEYLSDITGNVRYFPMTCSKVIDTTELRQNIEQLWAEASHLEAELSHEEAMEEATARQEKRKPRELISGVIYPDAAISALQAIECDKRYDGDEIYARLSDKISSDNVQAVLMRNGVEGMFVLRDTICRIIDPASQGADIVTLDSRTNQSIKKAMTKLGWRPENKTLNGTRLRFYAIGKLPSDKGLTDKHHLTCDFNGQVGSKGEVIVSLDGRHIMTA